MGEIKPTEHQSRSPSKRRIASSAVLLISILILVTFLWFYIYAVTPGPSGSHTVRLIIPKGASFQRISKILVENRLIHEDVRFHILARLNGYSSKLRAGEFELQTGRKPLDVLRALMQATSIQHRITIAEGLNAAEIGTLLAKNNWSSKTEFLSLIEDKEFIESLGFVSLNSLEGYLYPDTYYLTREPSPETAEIIKKMVNRFQQVWQQVATETDDQHKVVILASIVEKETADPSERPRIASVFRNRLKKGMKLQSDPTVIYGIKEFDGNITKKDLKTKTPYNTYVIKGLPAGPISNPGKDALAAVLDPADEKYLYFVSRNDGTHHFSTTLKEHNRAVRKYQRK